MRLPYRAALRSAVGAEAHAYGFTLVVWTTGALALTEEGLVAGRVLAFLGGALAAMSLVVVGAYSGVRAAYLDAAQVRLAYGAIHVLSVAAGVGAGLLALYALDGAPAVATAAFAAVLVYNLILAVEVRHSVLPADPSAAKQEGAAAPRPPQRPSDS